MHGPLRRQHHVHHRDEGQDIQEDQEIIPEVSLNPFRRNPPLIDVHVDSA